MKFQESIANVNKDGKQSVCLKLKPDVQKFLELLQEHDLIVDTSDMPKLPRTIADCILVLDGQCCECDYIVTTDEDEEHDEQAFIKCIMGHEWAGVTEELLRKVWRLVKPLTAKEYITWG